MRSRPAALPAVASQWRSRGAAGARSGARSRLGSRDLDAVKQNAHASVDVALLEVPSPELEQVGRWLAFRAERIERRHRRSRALVLAQEGEPGVQGLEAAAVDVERLLRIAPFGYRAERNDLLAAWQLRRGQVLAREADLQQLTDAPRRSWSQFASRRGQSGRSPAACPRAGTAGRGRPRRALAT